MKLRTQTHDNCKPEIETGEDEAISSVIKWMEENNLDIGIRNYDLTNEKGESLANIDLAWPTGIQTGLSDPIALLIDESEETHNIVNQNGFKLYFTEIEKLKAYIVKTYIGA